MCERVVQVIPGLLRRTNGNVEEVRSLMVQIEGKQEQLVTYEKKLRSYRRKENILWKLPFPEMNSSIPSNPMLVANIVSSFNFGIMNVNLERQLWLNLAVPEVGDGVPVLRICNEQVKQQQQQPVKKSRRGPSNGGDGNEDQRRRRKKE
ncbi:hypothetical protein RJ639_012281 [Escallonia herrerae]|uniref:Uncharacterized protein n=1 Tax=Escallonia herrerae TaxID=1293975 RepID=A0AA88VL94_9ASTE|nr:hypothetical protein RJ639_012281 [Escallonia herrerae]